MAGLTFALGVILPENRFPLFRITP